MGKSKEQLIIIEEMIDEGKSVNDIADLTGYSVSQIMHISEKMQQIDDSKFYDEQN